MQTTLYGSILIIINLKQHLQTMTENFDTSQHESIVQTEPNLSQLKKQVEITPSTLKEITLKQEFLERVIELSSNAKESINIERAKQALVYLNQAQKILEYAASCGKTIDKYIIISVLHNIACCYQKIWQLQKCSQYLEALIFNFNSFMKVADQNTSSDDSTSGRTKPKSKKNQDSIIAEGLDRKTFLAKYYLQFCAVNSQTDNHSGALIAGRKSIEIMKTLFKEMAQMAPTMKKMTYEKKSQFQYKIKLIELGSRVNDGININHYDTIYQAAKYYLRQWKIQKDNKDRPDRNYVLQQEFKNYSIGNAMQINPMTYKEFQERDTKNYTSKMILEKILLMALGYFTISTELRLIANKKTNKKEGEKGSSAEFKQSQIYHLLSIIIAASCIPFEILYMKHVLSSYGNHYGGDLLVQSQSDSRTQNNKFEQLIFPILQIPVRKVTTNNSFSGSIDQQQDTMSKFQREDGENFISTQIIKQRKKEDNWKEDETIKNEVAKKLKVGAKNKSKSKSKHMKSMTFLAAQQKSDKASPMPKSPNAHMKSPKNNMIKVKTSYKVKVSTEKIVTTNHPGKQEKSRKKKEVRAENIQFDYFMGRSKDLKKMKKTIETGLNLASPRPNHNSKSSSKRQSPIPKYFQQLKPQSPMMKNIKSPRKNTGKTGGKETKNNFQQYYL